MENLDYLASKGRQPYVALAERCALVFTEAGFIAEPAKRRKTPRRH